jgi:hypothetical protein
MSLTIFTRAGCTRMTELQRTVSWMVNNSVETAVSRCWAHQQVSVSMIVMNRISSEGTISYSGNPLPCCSFVTVYTEKTKTVSWCLIPRIVNLVTVCREVLVFTLLLLDPWRKNPLARSAGGLGGAQRRLESVTERRVLPLLRIERSSPRV